MKNKSLLESLNSAVEGFIYVMRTQRNMRIHILLGILILIIGIYLDLTKSDLLLVTGAISLLLICEMINTSVELAVDLIKDTFHPVARIIKDVLAGAVFVSAVNVIIVVYTIFSRNLAFRLEDGIYKIKQLSWHITFIAFIFVLFLVVIGKVISRKGTPFRGGMPSGHSAFAFSICTIIAFLTERGLITVLVFVMAALIARHRIIMKIHSTWEVVVGALLGSLTTALVFQVLR